MPSAWISLDENDNDFCLFLNYLLAAIHTTLPDVGQKTLDMANALTLPPVPRIAGTPINELDQIEQSFILVLDDLA